MQKNGYRKPLEENQFKTRYTSVYFKLPIRSKTVCYVCEKSTT